MEGERAAIIKRLAPLVLEDRRAVAEKKKHRHSMVLYKHQSPCHASIL